MMVQGGYAWNKRWRKKHPELRYAGKLRYYAQFRKNAKRAWKPWTEKECALILAKNRPSDRVLHKRLERSVQAIQIMRHTILHGRAGKARLKK